MSLAVMEMTKYMRGVIRQTAYLAVGKDLTYLYFELPQSTVIVGDRETSNMIDNGDGKLPIAISQNVTLVTVYI